MNEQEGESPHFVDGIGLARGTIWLVLDGLLANLLALIYFVVVAHLVSDVSDLGLISFITMLNQLGVIVFTLSIPRASVRYISSSLAKGAKPDATGLVRRLTAIGLLCSFIGGLVFVLLGDVFSGLFYGSSEAAPFIRLVAADTVPFVMVQFPKQMLLGTQRYRTVSLIEITQNCIRFGLAAMFFAQGFGITGIVYGWVMGDTAATVAALAACLTIFRGESTAGVRLRNVAGFAGQLLITSSFDYVLQALDRYAVLVLAGSTLLGLYSPAATASSLALVIPMMITSALFPHFSGLLAGGPEDHLSRSEIQVSRWVFLAFVPTAFGIAALSLPIVTLVGGSRYAPASAALMISSIAIGLASPTASINAKLLGSGRVMLMAAASMTAIVAGIAASLALIPALGVIGAALVHGAMLLTYLCVAASVLRRTRQLNLDFRMLRHSLLGSTVMFVVVAGSQVLVYSMYLLPLYVILGVLAYSGLLRILGSVEASDISFLRGFLPKRLGFVLVLLERVLLSKPE